MMKKLTFLGTISLLFSASLSAQPYCTSGLYDPSYGCQYGTAIQDFTLSSLQQSGTGCSGQVADYTSVSIPLALGESFIFHLKSSSNYTDNEFLAIWIDFNDNFSFDDAGEMLFSSSTGGELSGVLTIPGTVPAGDHRLRVRLKSDYPAVPFSSGQSCSFFYYGEAHDYTATLTAAPACTGLSFLSISDLKKYSAKINWGCGGCPGSFMVEYGAPGFTPGTGSVPGPGGTIINTSSSSATLTGLSSATNYDVYVRRVCGPGNYSLNFGPGRFLTLYDACGTLQPITCDQTISAAITAGRGEFDFYPGSPFFTDGRELVYAFTPAVSGKYIVHVTNTNFNGVSYLFREALDGCNRYDWTQKGYAYSAPYDIVLGTLTAGTPYLLMLDAQGSTSLCQHEFNIGCFIPYDPCLSVAPVSCGVTTSLTLDAGAGAFDIPTSLNDPSICQGKEKILSFTAPSSGRIRIGLSAPGFVNGAGVFIKNAAGGCTGNNWMPLGYSTFLSSYSVWYSEPTEVSAGTTYLIMCDALTLAGGSITVDLSCPESWDPCSSISAITCDEPIMVSIPAGLGKYDTIGLSCSYGYTYGKEQVYSFTALQSGYHTITLTDNPFANIRYRIKEAGTCNSQNWRCMGPLYSSSEFFTPLPLIAGHAYFIMLDAGEVLLPTSQTFIISCALPPDPCTSVTSLDCGETIDIELPAGQSTFSPYIGSFGQATGHETIFSFTPSLTGTYFLTSSNHTLGTSLYAIKPASDGCTTANWTFIAQNYQDRTVLIPMQLMAGTAYYILVENAYGSFLGLNETLEVFCPGSFPDPCSAISAIPTCGESISTSIPSGIGLFASASTGYYYGSGIQGPAGNEKIYSFTPSASGRHVIKSISGTGEVTFAIKAASAGCTGSDWLIIGNGGGTFYYYPGELSIPFELLAGQSYLILVDANDIAGATHSWEILCPEAYDPCQSITQISCGTTYSLFIDGGYGSYFQTTCGYPYPNGINGREQIFAFTAEESGFIQLIEWGYGTFEVYLKNAVSGCGEEDWICVGDASNSYNTLIIPFSLVEGQDYFLMFIPVQSNSTPSQYTANFEYRCVMDCLIYADADGDGFGDPERPFTECAQIPYGYAYNNDDCDDAQESVFPGAAEIPGNGVDDDCNGIVDDGVVIQCSIVVSPSPTVEGQLPQTIYLGYGAQSVSLTGSASGGTGPYTYSWSEGGTGNPVTVSPEVTTSYTLTVTDALGNTSSCQVVVDVIDVRCGNNNDKVLICHNAAGIWLELCVNANSVAAHLTQHGDYLGPCVSASSMVDAPEIGHVDEMPDVLDEITFYPNPSDDQLTVQFPVFKNSGGIEVRVIDLNGKTVMNRLRIDPEHQRTIQIQTGHLPNGLYILILTEPLGQRRHIKFIVQHA